MKLAILVLLTACGKTSTPAPTEPAATAAPAAASEAPAEAAQADVVKKPMYGCPMHPNATSAEPGDCSTCGMKMELMEGHDHAAHDHGKMMDLPKEGKKFDPPVDKAELPKGAWMCDMGTVHYASMDKGDGSCPVCGMTLSQNGTHEQEPADATHNQEAPDATHAQEGSEGKGNDEHH